MKANIDIYIGNYGQTCFMAWHGNAHILKDAELAIQSIEMLFKKLYFK